MTYREGGARIGDRLGCSEGVLNRLDAVVGLDPNTVLLMIGVDDLGYAFSADEISANVETVVDQLPSKLVDAKFVLHGVLCSQIACKMH